MATVTDSPSGNLSGKMGRIVYYEVDGKNYARQAPHARTKAQKEAVSELSKLNQSKMRLAQKYLKPLKKVIQFGYQELATGARRPFHACLSQTLNQAFEADGRAHKLSPALLKVSSGSLMPPFEAKAARVEDGIMITWTENSWVGNAKPWDRAFVVIHHPEDEFCDWVSFGKTRDEGKMLFPLPESQRSRTWHVYLAFSRENSRTKKTQLSDSVYLGRV